MCDEIDFTNECFQTLLVEFHGMLSNPSNYSYVRRKRTRIGCAIVGILYVYANIKDPDPILVKFLDYLVLEYNARIQLFCRRSLK